MVIIITILMGIWAAAMFYAAEHKEEIWDKYTDKYRFK